MCKRLELGHGLVYFSLFSTLKFGPGLTAKEREGSGRFLLCEEEEYLSGEALGMCPGNPTHTRYVGKDAAKLWPLLESSSFPLFFSDPGAKWILSFLIFGTPGESISLKWQLSC